MSIDHENIDQPRRRAANQDSAMAQKARQLVAPFQKQIGPWQARLAHLRVMTMVRAKEDVRTEAAKLVPLVVATRVELEAAVAELGDDAVAHHNSVSSVRAALIRLREELESL